MDKLINPFTVSIAFELLLILLSLFKPQISRVVTGIFFLLMALGVNLTVLLTDPGLYALAGKNAILPLYRWFFATVLGYIPVPFVIALIAFETAVGLLILHKGKAVKIGLLGGILFCLALFPVGIEEASTPLLALALALLLRRPFERSLWEALSAKFHPRAVKHA